MMHELSMVGICEPKLSTHDVESIRVRLNFDHVVSNPSRDVWVFFSLPFSSVVVGDSDQHLSISFGHPQCLCPFNVSFVHAKCTAVKRRWLWHALLRDKPCQESWYIVGDFNFILSANEKRGGRLFQPSQGLELSHFVG